MPKLRLKQIRKRLRVTQKEFAQTIGVSQNYLSEIENNKKTPSLHTLEQIALKLKLPITKILVDGNTFCSKNSNSSHG